MKRLIEILNEICGNIEFHAAIQDSDEDTIRRISEDYFNEFRSFYSQNNRHRYSEISKHIATLQGDMLESLTSGMQAIIESAEQNDYHLDPQNTEQGRCYLCIMKLFDHIELEAFHISNTQETHILVDEFANKKSEINDLLNKAQKTLEETEKSTKHLSEQLISILGIFAGIIVTFSFATSTIGEALSNLTAHNTTYLGFIISLLGTVFLNVLALLMVFVVKISGRDFTTKVPWGFWLAINIVLWCLTAYFYFNI